MMRILINKAFRHHTNILLCIVILALLLFIHVNINSQQVNQKFNYLESNFNEVQYHKVQQNKQEKVHQNKQEIRSEEDDVSRFTTTAATTTTSYPSTTGTLVETSPPTENATSSSKDTDLMEKHMKELRKKGLRMGHVNSHLWYKVCTVSMDSMRQQPLFPLWPGARGQPEMPNELESFTTELWTFQRVLGYLYPPISGFYKFKIFSGTMAEFWLSSDSDPRNASLLARNNRNPLLSVIFRSGPLMITSKPIYLNQGETYYFEMQHSCNNVRRGKVRVRWMLPGNKEYTGIPNTSLSTFINGEDYLVKNARESLTSSASLRLRESVLKQPESYEWINKTFAEPFEAYSNYTRENFHTVEFADRWKIMSVFNECDYTPTYTRKRDYKRYQGVYFTHYSDVFPGDDTADKQWEDQKSYQDTLGNTLISEKEVIQIVSMFMGAVEEEFPGEYILANVINLERNFDKERGNRYLLELLLKEVKTSKTQRISEYLYRFHKEPEILCKPKGLRWRPNVKINAILTTKSQGPWVIHYIENMAKIVHATGDQNVHFIVVDYGNNGVDVAEVFRRNNISQFTVIKKTGKFHKTLAIDEAARFGEENDTIIFLNDLHLVAPNNIFESVRKHTVEGKMTFTPVVFRLSQCARPETRRLAPSGYWESFGYGIFSAYKSDWKFFGGVNVKEFKHKWGGEDWEMVDRVLGKGLEIERLRLPHFYHFYHDKTGMWQHAK